ncbi:hypothetical protein [Rhizobium lusitanum]|uniref:hypothetical protein n=1 Tax=Rhizobium lusitanum TaxID=293958 RepID=UPI00195EB9EF|nr:hypothetical protein [Rhizobium lusitanum]MBM7048371.1 hypothetical protein [Rhizobium lusitanum]
MKSQIAVVISLAALAGCTTSSASQNTGKSAQSLPANYRAQIIERLRTKLNDPFSIKEAEIIAPTPISAGFEKLPGACVRFFAKNQYGAYMGQDIYRTAFKNGVMVPSGTVVQGMCEGTWQPFSELNGKE